MAGHCPLVQVPPVAVLNPGGADVARLSIKDCRQKLETQNKRTDLENPNAKMDLQKLMRLPCNLGGSCQDDGAHYILPRLRDVCCRLRFLQANCYGIDQSL